VTTRAGLYAVAALLLVGCGGEPKEPDVSGAASITVTSIAFSDGAAIPRRFSCDGDNVSPPLTWSGVPSSASALALVVDDLDAPSGTFTHWVVLDLPATTDALDQAVDPHCAQAKNSAGRAGWFGPCPPSGTHHYRFTVYALSAPTGLADDDGLDEALRAIEARAISWGRLSGTFSRG
jgi:Raf kinase inhibitor-like YbhB/YbcL family protein